MAKGDPGGPSPGTPDDNGTPTPDGGSKQPDGGNRAPTAIKLSRRTVKENQAAIINVGQLSTEDPDAGDSHTYRIVGGKDSEAFFIEGNFLRTTRSLDYERQNRYRIQIETKDQAGETFQTNFTIRVQDIKKEPLSLPNLSRTTNLGTLTDTLSRNDALNSRANRRNQSGTADDWFRFSLAQSGRLTLNLQNLKADANLQILDGNGISLAIARRRGKRSEQINLDFLTAGTYFLRVFPGSNRQIRTAYQLSLSTTAAPLSSTPPILNNATPTPPAAAITPAPTLVPAPVRPPVTPNDPNGDVERSSDLGTVPVFDPSRSITTPVVTALYQEGYVGKQEPNGLDGSSYLDQYDYYTFTLKANYDVAIGVAVPARSANANLTVYDRNFQVIATSNNPGTEDEAIYLPALAAGTYYAQVTPGSSAETSYKLGLIAGEADGDGNGNFAVSQDSGTLNDFGRLTQSGTIDTNGDNDFFRFMLAATRQSATTQITLKNLSGDANIQVFDSLFRVIGSTKDLAFDPALQVKSLSFTAAQLEPGDIGYIRVTAPGSAVRYDLEITGG